MDFKALGNSLISTFAEDKILNYFNRKQARQPLALTLELSSSSLVTRNITYRSSSSLDRQHTLEMDIDTVSLTDLSLKLLKDKYKKSLGIRICWLFMSYESTTPIIQVKDKLVKINDKQKYTICLNDVFINYISKRTIQFDVFAVYEYKEKHLGKSEMDLRDLVHFPDEQKVKELHILTVNKHRIFKKCQNNDTLGYLALKYCLKPYSLTEIPRRLHDVEVEELYHQTSQKDSSNTFMESVPSTSLYGSKNFQENAKRLNISPSDSSFFKGLLCTALGNDEFVAQNEEGRNKIKERNKLNYNRSLEEYAILSGSSVDSLKSFIDQEIKVRNYDEEHIYEPAILIDVVSLYMSEKRYPLQSNEVNELYIEYSFLSRSGKDMETLSLPLLENRIIEYNFKRTFLIDATNNRNDCKILAKAIKEKRAIKFMIIEEPATDLNKFQICKEIAFTEINLFQLIQNEENIISDSYPVLNLQFPHEEIGYLKICIYGVQAIRRAALRVLAPRDYTYI